MTHGSSDAKLNTGYLQMRLFNDILT